MTSVGILVITAKHVRIYSISELLNLIVISIENVNKKRVQTIESTKKLSKLHIHILYGKVRIAILLKVVIFPSP